VKETQQTPSQSPPHKTDTPTQYSVAAPGTESRAEPAKRRVAVFVAHGMGQQIPFETLDSIAESLRVHDASLTGRNTKPVSNSIKAEDQWLARIELELKSGPSEAETHIYEGYWAPLTEGRINLRQVMAFLAGAGTNGLKVARKTFRRWLMGKYEIFPTPIRIVLYLLVALAAIAALVVMNSTIVVVATARALFAERPWWLSEGLFADLTTTFDGVVSAMIVFGASLFVGHVMRGRAPVIVRKIWGWLTALAFLVAIFAIILAGVAVFALFFLHIRGGAPATAELWQNCFSKAALDRLNNGFDFWVFWLVVVVLALRLAWWIGVIAFRLLRDISDPRGRWLTLAVVLVFALLVSGIVVLVRWCFPLVFASSGATALRHGVAWPLVIIASAYIRSVLVQYLGDVAIYVMPYKLDAFNDLRKEIKETVYKVAHAVYALKDQGAVAPAYDRVIILGHSLGSVIAYDALNRLIQEDRAGATANALDVVGRTPLFLTFGSPLDKTAFIFGAQGHGTTEAREALAASVQPMIQDYAYRPKQWVNIYSPWDIISGYLDLYDLPGSTDPKKVDNRKDAEATTLLMAHTEYWSDPLLVQTLYDAL
jgi:hypothetical protein